MKYSKVKRKAITDILLALTFFISIISGFLLMIEILGNRPISGRGTGEIQLLNLSVRNPYMIIDLVSGILMISLVAYHLVLNWKVFTGYLKVLLKQG